MLDIDGIPTGAPEVQLVWKALRPRPEDDVDKDAVLPGSPTRRVAWYERAILSIHPHSTWAIHVRSPFAPGEGELEPQARASARRCRGAPRDTTASNTSDRNHRCAGDRPASARV